MSRRSHSFLSPKALAEAIGVSESSVKRWADDGRIQIQRTSGGHRRIPLAEAARFVREERLTLADPASLGLVVPHHLEAAADPIEAALRRGATTELHDLLASRYLAGEPLASLFDGPLAHGLAAVGELWNSDDSGIFVEHRASAAVRDALAGLGRLVPKPAAAAPRAVGGCLAGDPGQLATAMASLVLASEGLATMDLGADTPASALLHAAGDHDAGLVWLSITHAPQDPSAAQAELDRLREGLGARRLVVGGAGARGLDLGRGPVAVATMAELAAFGAGLVSAG